MSAKQKAVAQNDQNNNRAQDYKDKIAFFKRHAMRLYLQYINPKLGRLIEVIAHPVRFYHDVKPDNVGLWLMVAAISTALLVLLMPAFFLEVAAHFFLCVFFFGPTVVNFFIRFKDSFKNLLVAYPGKHLLHQEIKMENPISEGVADIMLDGKEWQVRGDDCPAGTRVRVIAINESVLFVKVPVMIN